MHWLFPLEVNIIPAKTSCYAPSNSTFPSKKCILYNNVTICLKWWIQQGFFRGVLRKQPSTKPINQYLVSYCHESVHRILILAIL